MLPEEAYEETTDIGTGIGYYLPTLSEISIRVNAIDISPKTLEYAKEMVKNRKIDNIKFKQGEIYNLPLKDKTQDLIIAINIIEHLEKPEKGLKEIERTMKDYAWAIIAYPIENGLLLNLRKIDEAILRPHRYKEFRKHEKNGKGMDHYCDHNQIRKEINKIFKTKKTKKVMGIYEIKLVKRK